MFVRLSKRNLVTFLYICGAKGKRLGRPRVVADRTTITALRADGLGWKKIAATLRVGRRNCVLRTAQEACYPFARTYLQAAGRGIVSGKIKPYPRFRDEEATAMNQNFERTWMMFVDGENFTIRGQKGAEANKVQLVESRYYKKDCFVWLPGVHATCRISSGPTAI